VLCSKVGQYPAVIVKMEFYEIGAGVDGGVVLAGLTLDIASQVSRFDLSVCDEERNSVMTLCLYQERSQRSNRAGATEPQRYKAVDV
jgi:hypothetical protein